MKRRGTGRGRTPPPTITPQECLNFLSNQEECLVDAMLKVGLRNPVGVVADLRDPDGRRLALLLGFPQSKIDAEVAASTERTFPLFTGVVTWAEVGAVICEVDPHAPSKMYALWPHCDRTGLALAIAIAGGCCAYTVFALRPGPGGGAAPGGLGSRCVLPDGQHRHGRP